MSGQTSFRRLLLTRILVFSIPILLLGVAVTFRKARSSLLETARQNLTESAVRKAEGIQNSIRSLQTGLAIAAQTRTLQTAELEASQSFLEALRAQLDGAQCVQLTQPNTTVVLASTCNEQPIVGISDFRWPSQLSVFKQDLFNRFVVNPLPPRPRPLIKLYSHLDVVISTPVYDAQGQLRYTLSVQAVIQQMESADPWSLQGYTVVIDPNGTFLSHPLPDRVGRRIALEGDDVRYDDVLKNTQRGDRGVRHLFDFMGDQTEWLAGFSPATVSVAPDEEQTWTVLAVTKLDHALQGLQDITQTLLMLTAGLLMAHLLTMLYTARDLARPIEKLGKYAQALQRKSAEYQSPQDFRVREINQLADVLNNMVHSLRERAEALENAWQEAEAANRLKTEFLATTSHELRTPLNAIIGCLSLVEDGYCDSSEEEKDMVSQAHKAARGLVRIINDLLAIRSIEEGKLHFDIEAVDLCQILQQVLDLQVVEMQRKGLHLLAPEMSHPVIVKADAQRLKQVFTNVVSNAVKFTDAGCILLELRLENRSLVGVSPSSEGPKPAENHSHVNGSNGNHGNSASSIDPEDLQAWVVVAVKDTGIGIEPDQQKKLFRPFAMADGSTTRKHEGTGLGLAISRNLIERMGGEISLSSDGINSGTTVEVSLPIMEGVDNLRRLSERSLEEVILPSNPEHIPVSSP
ncbi:sensor histidine kinase [Leptolyngbya sp. AN02str]|uniref:sensor histidine kinase n=1 Tax=Leptolyngbya sp. AN02str TaxID=3423363 RepID=UPI003D315708